MNDDLLLTPELIPDEVMSILNKYDFDPDYRDCISLNEELNEIGYSIDFDLGYGLFDLKKLD